MLLSFTPEPNTYTVKKNCSGALFSYISAADGQLPRPPAGGREPASLPSLRWSLVGHFLFLLLFVQLDLASGGQRTRGPLSATSSSSSSAAATLIADDTNSRANNKRDGDACMAVSPADVPSNISVLHSNSHVGSRPACNRQAPGYLADCVSTPPQENKKKRRLIVASHAPHQSEGLNQQPVIAAAPDNKPRLRCPFAACAKASPSFAGWQHAEQLLQHINCIHASKNQWPSEAFLGDFNCIACKECKLVVSSRARCPSCRGRRIQRVPEVVIAEEDIPDIDSGLQLSASQMDSVWQILRSPAVVIKRVPRCFRQLCGDELSTLLRAAGTDNNITALIQ